jgi:ubiquinone/menaquinone biosynthesis C-methylase UbiE
MEAAIVNTEQAAAWDGHEGDVWTEHADRYDRAARRVWQRFPGAKLVARDAVVLDVGCGTGESTRQVAGLASDGTVTGIDLSARMLELARTRSVELGVRNVTFVQVMPRSSPSPRVPVTSP